MPTSDSKPHDAPRRGYQYQDLIGAWLALRLLDRGDPPLSVTLEPPRAVRVDDVLVEYRDRTEFYQIKWREDRTFRWSIRELGNRSGAGRSLALDLAASWVRLRARPAPHIILYSNRGLESAGLQSLFDDEDPANVVPHWRHEPAAGELRELCEGAQLNDDDFACFMETLKFEEGPRTLDGARRRLADRLSVVGADPTRLDSYVAQCFQWSLDHRPLRRDDICRELGLVSQLLDPIHSYFQQDEHAIQRVARLDELDARVEATQSGYIIVTGGPGSGKSHVLAQYAERREQRTGVPVLRYHCFASPEDAQGQERLERATFERGLSDQITDRFRGLAGESDTEAWRPRPLDRLTQAAQRLAEQGRRLVCIVDGLDHAARAELGGHGLLGWFPRALPANVAVIVGTQDHPRLPSHLRPGAAESTTIDVGRFSPEETRQYLDATGVCERAAWAGQQIELCERVQHVTQGLPLYLRYVARQLRAAVRGHWRQAVARLAPLGDAGIEAYYDSLWPDTKSRESEILTHLACCRFAVTPQELATIMGDADVSRHDVQDALDAVRHLLVVDTEGRRRVHHDSLAQFVVTRDPAAADNARRHVCDYLVDHPELEAYDAHAFYYLLRAGRAREVSAHCTHEWLDDRFHRVRPRAETDQNLCIALDAAKHAANVSDIVRIGLLRTTAEERATRLLDDEALLRALVAMGDWDAARRWTLPSRWLVGSLNAGLLLADGLRACDDRDGAREALGAVESYIGQAQAAGDPVTGGNLDAGLLNCLRAALWDDPAEALSRLAAMRAEADESDVEDTDRWVGRLRRGMLEHLAGRKLTGVLQRLADAAGDGGDVAEYLALSHFAEGRPDLGLAVLREAGPSADARVRAWALCCCAAPPQEVAEYVEGAGLALPPGCLDLLDDNVGHTARELVRLAAIWAYAGRRDEVVGVCDALARPPGTAACVTCFALRIGLALGASLSDAPDEEVGGALGRAFRGLHYRWQALSDFARFGGSYRSTAATRAVAEEMGRLLAPRHAPLAPLVTQEAEGLRGYAFCSSELMMQLWRDWLPHVPRDAAREAIGGDAQRWRDAHADVHERPSHLLGLAALAASCGMDDEARQLVLEALDATHAYGHHKDTRLCEVIDALGALTPHMGRGDVLAIHARLLRMVSWIGEITDLRELRQVGEDIVEQVFRLDPAAGTRLYWELFDDEAFPLHADAARAAISRAAAEQCPRAGWALWQTLCDTGRDSMEDRVETMLTCLDAASSESTLWASLAEEARRWARVELNDDVEEVVRAVDASRSSGGLESWHRVQEARRRAQSWRSPDGTPPALVIEGRAYGDADLTDYAAASADQARRALAACRDAEDRYAFERPLAQGLARLASGVNSREGWREVRALVDEVGRGIWSGGAAAWQALAHTAQRLGLRDECVESLKQSHRAHHGWVEHHCGPEGAEPFRMMAQSAPEDARRFIVDDLTDCYAEHTWASRGTLVRVIEALLRLGDAPEALRTLDTWLTHCETLFRCLPDRSARYAWLASASTDEPSPLSSICTGFLIEHFGHPEADVRAAALAALVETAEHVGDVALLALAAGLSRDAHAIRAGCAAVLHTIGTRWPMRLAPFAEALAGALDDPAADVARSAREALLAFADADNTLVAPGIRRRAEACLSGSVVAVSSPAIVVPPSAVDVSHVHYGVPYPALDGVAQALGLDEGELDTRVALRVSRNGYDAARGEADAQRWHGHYINPGIGGDVLYHGLTRDAAWQALAEVVAEVLRASPRRPAVEADLLAWLRTYDPGLVGWRPDPRPEDVADDDGPDLSDEAWLAFADCAGDAGRLPGGPDWLCLAEACHSQRGARAGNVVRVCALVDEGAVDGACHWWESDGGGWPAHWLGPRDGKAPLALAEAMSLAAGGPDPWVAASGPVRPVVQTGVVQCVLGERVHVLLPAAWVMRDAGLEWVQGVPLAMRSPRGGDSRFERWAKGREDDGYNRHRSISGARLLWSVGLVERLLGLGDYALVSFAHELRELAPSSRRGAVAPTRPSERRRAARVVVPWEGLGPANRAS
jgi:hypothetical protein